MSRHAFEAAARIPEWALIHTPEVGEREYTISMAGNRIAGAIGVATAIIIASSVFAQAPMRRQQSPLCALPTLVPYTVPCAPVNLHDALCAHAGAGETAECAIGLVQGGCSVDRGAQRYEVAVGNGSTAEKRYVAVRKVRCAAPPVAGGSSTWRAQLPSGWGQPATQ